MNTPAHLIAASALLGRNDSNQANRWVVAGALLPDIWIYGFFVWASAIQGLPGETIWSETYWTEPWQIIGAVLNSLPLATMIIILGAAFRQRWLLMLGLAVLVHIAMDLPLHGEDAHRHFWPVSDWRFESPVSYWNPGENGRWGILIEFAVVLSGSLVLWMRFPRNWLRVLLGLAVVISAAMVAVYWVSPPGFGS